MERTQVRDAVFLAIERLRESLIDDDGLRKDESTVLIGERGELDSMGFLNFVVAVEEEMTNALSRPFHVDLERLMGPDTDAPSVSTVGGFIDVLHGSLRQ